MLCEVFTPSPAWLPAGPACRSEADLSAVTVADLSAVFVAEIYPPLEDPAIGALWNFEEPISPG